MSIKRGKVHFERNGKTLCGKNILSHFITCYEILTFSANSNEHKCKKCLNKLING